MLIILLGSKSPLRWAFYLGVYIKHLKSRFEKFMSKLKPYTYWIFCDESGNLSSETDRYLIGAAVGTQHPDALKKVGDNAWKTNRRFISHGTALHAADLPPKRAMNFLQQIAKIPDLTLSVAILDKQWLWNPKGGRDHLYNELFAHLIQQSISLQKDTIDPPIVVLEMHPLIVLEKRDSLAQYRSDLITKLKKYAGLEAMQIEIRGKEDPEWGRQLQVADFVAWSTYQKYAKREPHCFDIIQDKVKAELKLGVDGSGIMRPISEMNNTKGWE